MNTLTHDGSILTFTGKKVFPLMPNMDSITIEDIAHALSNQCRFAGHTKWFYSVAEHSCRVSELVPSEDAFWGLMHDSSEAYLQDFVRPLKELLEFGNAYRIAEDRLMKEIQMKFGLSAKMPDTVKLADNAMLYAEKRWLKDEDVETEYDKFRPLSPYEAEVWFLELFNVYQR